MDKLIKAEFGEHFSKQIYYEIQKDETFSFQLYLQSTIICRDSLEYMTKRVVKKYNKSR